MKRNLGESAARYAVMTECADGGYSDNGSRFDTREEAEKIAAATETHIPALKGRIRIMRVTEAVDLA